MTKLSSSLQVAPYADWHFSAHYTWMSAVLDALAKQFAGMACRLQKLTAAAAAHDKLLDPAQSDHAVLPSNASNATRQLWSKALTSEHKIAVLHTHFMSQPASDHVAEITKLSAELEVDALRAACVKAVADIIEGSGGLVYHPEGTYEEEVIVGGQTHVETYNLKMADEAIFDQFSAAFKYYKANFATVRYLHQQAKSISVSKSVGAAAAPPGAATGASRVSAKKHASRGGKRARGGGKQQKSRMQVSGSHTCVSPTPAREARSSRSIHRLSSRAVKAQQALTRAINREHKSLITHQEPTFVYAFDAVLQNEDLAYHDLTTNKDLRPFSHIFSRGAKFIPNAYRLEKEQVHQGLKLWKHKLLWQLHFLGEPPRTAGYHPKFKIPCTPYRGLVDNGTLTVLESLSRALDELVDHVPQDKVCDRSYLKVIRDLRERSDIKILMADKNLGMVVMDIELYDKLVRLHLDNKSTYDLVGHVDASGLSVYLGTKPDLFEKVNLWIEVQDYLKARNEWNPLRSCINKYYGHKQWDTLPPFHILAKLHKAKLSGRPIVGVLSWITTPFSVILDVFLQKEMSNCRYILKSAPQLLDDLKSLILDPTVDYTLLTLDVDSLYTNIRLGLLHEVLHSINPLFARIADFICRNNFFRYGNEIYKQKDGIAMGTNVAVCLAQIYLAHKLDPSLAGDANVVIYRRFIDDCFLLMKGLSEQEILARIETWQHIVDGISLTWHISKVSVDFLDISVYFETTDNSKRFAWKTYQKDLNKYLYIPGFSNHPEATLIGWIIGERKRYRLTNSDRSNERKIVNLFVGRLLRRGYPVRLIKKAFDRYGASVRGDSLTPQHANKRRLPIVLPYSSAARQLSKQMQGEIHRHSKALPKPLQDRFQIGIVNSNNPSLGKLLLRSNLNRGQIAHLARKRRVVRDSPGRDSASNASSIQGEPDLGREIGTSAAFPAPYHLEHLSQSATQSEGRLFELLSQDAGSSSPSPEDH